ncbi:MAG TPA: formate dehydrogenase accessory sulfurtransferase FdhD [Vicinamibacterales bacterium]|nr:formate dehydrogenase accessory sulfurtransferase FdhD [Vicinamibacterales bacterium]
MNDRVVIATVARVIDGVSSVDQDLVAAEAPLEILLAHDSAGAVQSMGLVMRTPGDDEDLVTGLLVSEQIISRPEDVISMAFEAETGPDVQGAAAHSARARVTVPNTIELSSQTAARALDRTSSCGLCGRLSMQTVQGVAGRRPDAPAIDAAAIESIPGQLRRGQAVFAETGGLHAAALCGLDGRPWLVREDVGRHNAVDKVVGAALRARRLPAANALLAVSGRVAFEIVQKAAAAGVLGIVAVGAPSSLAVDAARAAGLTLVGFTREGRFNIYTGRERVTGPTS